MAQLLSQALLVASKCGVFSLHASLPFNQEKERELTQKKERELTQKFIIRQLLEQRIYPYMYCFSQVIAQWAW